jgi:hypothetical protein
MVIDKDGLAAVRTQRALYTNPEFIRTLCDDICVPPMYERYGEYTDKLDTGLYLIGWRIEPTPDGFKAMGLTYITVDEMSPLISTGGAVGLDHIMWRSAIQWATRLHNIYIEEKPKALVRTGITQQFIDFYEEYLLP